MRYLYIVLNINLFVDFVHGVFTRFSLFRNGKILFDNKKNDDYIQCVDGIRAITMFWIVLTHHLYIFLASPLINLNDVDTVIQIGTF